MTLIVDFILRAETYAKDSGQSLSTLSRKLLNDGKGLARLKEGGQCTLKTMDEALAKLTKLETELNVNAALNMTHLDRLEAESIHIMREVAAQCENPVMLYSVGKDSSVMLHLAEKAFYPSRPPFPLMHVDTMWKFKEMIAFRDQRAKEVGMELIVHINPDGKRDNVGPFTHGSAVHTDIMKTQGLKQALDAHKFDAAFGGARRDEEKSRAKERIFSFRTDQHRWDAKNQRPELWNIYNTRVHKGESMRVFPLSNWTELDIWQYIYKEKVPIPDLYLSKKRPVVEKDGVLILVDDDRMPIGPDEVIEEKMVRFRTLGCYPLTGAVESEADTLPDVIQEMLLTTTSERTLIGRLLYDSKLIYEDQLATIEKDSKKSGTQGDKIDLALLVDGLAAEREQGITIDVAYRFFSTDKRKFIVADTPGHVQYTRNMATGASTADVAVLLIDARYGVQEQTRRHAYIVSLLGVKHVVVAINKMDLNGFDQSGDNVTTRSEKSPWYRGPALLEYLETVDVDTATLDAPFRLPVQWVNRPNLDFRGFSGTIASGTVNVGDEIIVIPSGKRSRVKEIVTYDGSLDVAREDMAVTLTLTDEIDISRGDIICKKDTPAQQADQFQAHILWMSEAAKTLDLNEVGVTTLSLGAPIGFDAYSENRHTGSFILIDRQSHATVGVGMLEYALRRASNVVWQDLDVNKSVRSEQKNQKPVLLWFTGLSGSGKSTIANLVEKKLLDMGRHTYTLDGDNVRHGLNRDLGFTKEDRVENIRRIAEVAKLMVDAGLITMASFISPYRAERQMARDLLGDKEFVEIFVNTPLTVAEERDVKGLYAKARRGEIVNTVKMSAEEAAGMIVKYLDENGYLSGFET